MIDMLLRCGSPHLDQITEEQLIAAVADYRDGRVSARRNGIFKISRGLADKRIISAPLTTNRGPKKKPSRRSQPHG
jgi:hypothetical protein